MGIVLIQRGFGWGKGRCATPRVPAFPPNREIAEGEPCCATCGSGQSTHENGTRDHRFQFQMAKAHLRARPR